MTATNLKKISFVIVLIFLFAGCASVPTREQIKNADYGEYPETYEQRIKDYFSNILRDPYTVQYRFHVPFKGWLNKPFYSGLEFGWIVRVWVNAKNAFGGYTGEKQYMFFFKNGIMRETGYLSSSWEPYFPDPAEQFANKGRLGILLSEEGFVLEVKENSPALIAGIKKGDKLIKIDDQDLQGNNTSDIIEKITGEPGTKVKLIILRDDKEFTFEIERQILK